MNKRLRVEEYYPGSSFLVASFERDRAELFARFAEFTPGYLADFNAKRAEVKALDQSVILTEEQKTATVELYRASGELNNELNFLVFYFKRANLDNGILTEVKKNLNKDNIEGACLKLGGIIQFITEKQALLESKGMSVGFVSELAATRDLLLEKNDLQNLKANSLKQLHSNNKVVYKALYGFISTVSDAGKIMYKGEVRADEYTVTKLIGRMRSGNEGGIKSDKPIV